MRLKFLYPNGDLEIVDCTWIAVATLAGSGHESQGQWAVIDFEGREIWKPLGCLIQVEVLQESCDPDTTAGEPTTALAGDLGYHR